MKNFLTSLTCAAAITAVTAIGSAEAELYGGAARAEAIIYAHPDYRGDAIIIQGAEPDLGRVGLNDRVSSIELQGQWEICTDPDFRGRCTLINGPVRRLADLRMNDNITSLRPMNGRGGRRGRHDHEPVSINRAEMRHYNQGFEGRSSVFFPRPRGWHGDRLRPRQRAAIRFCRQMGYASVLYANTNRRYLTDVLCAR